MPFYLTGSLPGTSTSATCVPVDSHYGQPDVHPQGTQGESHFLTLLTVMTCLISSLPLGSIITQILFFVVDF